MGQVLHCFNRLRCGGGACKTQNTQKHTAAAVEKRVCETFSGRILQFLFFVIILVPKMESLFRGVHVNTFKIGIDRLIDGLMILIFLLK